MKKTILFPILISLLFSFSSCSKETKKYTIIWKNFDGTILEVDTDVEEGSIPTFDGNNPTKEGDAQFSYTWSGWYPEIKSVSSNIEYIAQFNETINSYLVVFDTCGGTDIESQMVKYGYKISKPNNPIKTGYDFVNWTYQGKEWSFAGYVVSENMVLEANWTPATYSISYELDGGTNNQSNPTSYNIEQSKNLFAPTKEGYTFTGWYNGDTKVESISVGNYGDITLTAHWSINSYNVNATSSDSSKGKVSGTGSYQYNSEVTIIATPETGYTFTGWYQGTALISSSATYTFTLGSSNISFVANWTPATYSISYELDGGTNNQSNPTSYNIEQSKNLFAPTKEGYTFTGWYNGDTKVESISVGNYGDITLTAHWTIDTSTKVTAEYTDNVNDSTNMVVNKNNAAALNLDPSIFYVKTDKKGSSTECGLNKAGNFRLYNEKKATGNGGEITFTGQNITIRKVCITLASTNASTEYAVFVDDVANAITPSFNVYDINASHFTIKNTSASTDSAQLHMSAVEIYYTVDD